MNSKKWKQLGTGIGFISPNICGFLVFTLLPLIFSMILAFTNWDLRLHNMYKDNSIEFVGFENFIRLLKDEYFLQYFGNTLFFMMGIPFGIAGSLGAAMLLNNDFRGHNNKVWRLLIITAVMLASTIVLMCMGMRTSALSIIIASLGGLMLVGGVLGGSTVYRTLFFLPHFTSGVAVFILWKKMYSPIGPINSALAEPLNNLSTAINGLNNPNSIQIGFWLLGLAFIAVLAWRFKVINQKWREGEIDSRSVIIPTLLTCIPAYMFEKVSPVASIRWIPLALAGILLLACIVNWIIKKQDFPSSPWKGHGGMIVGALLFMCLQFVFIGLALVLYNLPEMASDGLEAPLWIADYYWAKPAIMIMSLWGSIGSNNMLLYLAGLSNIPPELYEAADIDGASGFQRFSSITWPQLAPVTFFIFIMSVMGGLQGGFETARTMTNGGPAGATTTLSYYIYTEGFTTGRLGYASAVGWGLFALVFSVTIFNWKFGSKYVND